MYKGFDINEYLALNQVQKEFWESRFQKNFDFLKDLTIKLITSLLMLNGGAAVASLAFLETLVSSSKNIDFNSATIPLFFFSAGCIGAVLLCAFSYFSQSMYTSAIDSASSIYTTNNWILFNEKIINFYQPQQISVSTEEKQLIVELLKRLVKENESYQLELQRLKESQKSENFWGNVFRILAIIIFVASAGAFCYGVYLMGTIFYTI